MAGSGNDARPPRRTDHEQQHATHHTIPSFVTTYGRCSTHRRFYGAVSRGLLMSPGLRNPEGMCMWGGGTQMGYPTRLFIYDKELFHLTLRNRHPAYIEMES